MFPSATKADTNRLQYEKKHALRPYTNVYSGEPAMPRRRRWTNNRQYRGLALAFLIAFVLMCALRFSSPQDYDYLKARVTGASGQPGAHGPREPQTPLGVKRDGIRIAKASMHYGQQNEMLERAIKSHERHNEMHGYAMAVLRRSVTNGYWNKLSYLLSLVVLELGRPESERVQWIMWTDADVVLLNPFIPLSTFLPPKDTQFNKLNFVFSRLNGELSSRVFFLRVCSQSVHFLVKSMAVPMIDDGAELGATAKDASAMAYILNETDFRDSAIYMPRNWFDTKQLERGFEGTMGSLLAEFPSTLSGDRWKFMSDCFDDVRSKKWDVPFERTFYREEVEEFWERTRQAKEVLGKADDKARGLKEEEGKELKDAVKRLHEVLYWELDMEERVLDAIKKAEEAMK